MPIIYQCGNCGFDYEDVNEQRECVGCKGDVCGGCAERGMCFTCIDDEPVDEPFDPDPEDIEWSDPEGNPDDI